jgi:hypothetical protein
MKFQIEDNSYALINFNTSVQVDVHGGSYLVKWFANEEQVGEMELSGGMWGAYPNEIAVWRIEFWKKDKLVSVYRNTLDSAQILIIADFCTPCNEKYKGKALDITPLKEYLDFITTKYKCYPTVYFKGSERYNLNPYPILKLNDKNSFDMIYKKSF